MRHEKAPPEEGRKHAGSSPFDPFGGQLTKSWGKHPESGGRSRRMEEVEIRYEKRRNGLLIWSGKTDTRGFLGMMGDDIAVFVKTLEKCFPGKRLKMVEVQSDS
jgi:hypothetical protein